MSGLVQPYLQSSHRKLGADGTPQKIDLGDQARLAAWGRRTWGSDAGAHGWRERRAGRGFHRVSPETTGLDTIVRRHVLQSGATPGRGSRTGRPPHGGCRYAPGDAPRVRRSSENLEVSGFFLWATRSDSTQETTCPTARRSLTRTTCGTGDLMVLPKYRPTIVNRRIGFVRRRGFRESPVRCCSLVLDQQRTPGFAKALRLRQPPSRQHMDNRQLTRRDQYNSASTSELQSSRYPVEVAHPPELTNDFERNFEISDNIVAANRRAAHLYPLQIPGQHCLPAGSSPHSPSVEFAQFLLR